MKKKLVLKPFVMPLIYVAVIGVLLFNMMIGIQKANIGGPIYRYVSPVVFFKDVPVISLGTTISKPFTSENIQIKRGFYDFTANEELQNNSIVYYENTYIQNSGIDYFSDKSFSIVSILPGTVIKISENDLTGKIVEIRHDNNLISIYQGLSTVDVKENETVSQKQVIGQSGTSKINNNEGNNLHFELFHNGQIVNPELYYNKKISEL